MENEKQQKESMPSVYYDNIDPSFGIYVPNTQDIDPGFGIDVGSTQDIDPGFPIFTGPTTSSDIDPGFFAPVTSLQTFLTKDEITHSLEHTKDLLLIGGSLSFKSTPPFATLFCFPSDLYSAIMNDSENRQTFCAEMQAVVNKWCDLKGIARPEVKP